MDVILRHEIVERAKAGDKVVLTGMLVVVPDSGGMARAGEAALSARDGPDSGQGFGGLKKMGVKELTYRTIFIACECLSPPAAGH
jgi:DNA replication licensing factor MCM6